jgi:hypothetical protein
MILHFSHIGLTDGRTFMIPFGLVSSEPALAAVKGCRYRSPTRAHADGAQYAETFYDSKGLRAPAAGAYGTRMGEHDELLRRFQPALRYDSMEQFFADGAAQWTDNPGNELRRAATADGGQGELVATPPTLSLDFLRSGRYADGTGVRDGDRIGYTRKDYRERYVALRQERPELRNRMYGRAVEVRGRVWLQYWLWYFYNDYNLALGKGRHEGDWEMIQLRLYDGTPDVAVYAQHRRAEKRPWGDVEKLADGPDTPVVYVARGSHASYFEAGYHETEAWYDLADGKRATPSLELEIVTDTEPAWIAWPGVWGDTRPRISGLDQPSPVAPCSHDVWYDPDKLLNGAWEPERNDPIDAPTVRVTRDPGGLRVDYDFSRNETPAVPDPASLQVTVNSRDERGVPPRTHTCAVAGRQTGFVIIDHPLDSRRHYDIYVATTGGDPPMPSASKLIELDPVGAGPFKLGLRVRLARLLSRVIAWLRRHRR